MGVKLSLAGLPACGQYTFAGSPAGGENNDQTAINNLANDEGRQLYRLPL